MSAVDGGGECAVADSAEVWFAEALSLYERGRDRIWRSRPGFGRGRSIRPSATRLRPWRSLSRSWSGEADPELACRALLQIARLRHEQSDALYEQILTQCTDEEVRGLAALMLGRRYRQAGRGTEAHRVLESISSDPAPVRVRAIGTGATARRGGQGR